METCDRCRRPTDVTIMSRFNLQVICVDCEDRERNHPEYRRAVEAELAACKRGEYNYPGIGLPSLADSHPLSGREEST